MRLVATLVCLLASPALAQQSSQAPETTESFGSWTVRCVGQETEKSCEAVLTVSGQGGLIAQIAFGRPDVAKEAVMAARTPLGVHVASPLALALQGEGGTIVSAAFSTCLPAGCLAQARVSDAELDAFGAGETATIEFTERTGRKVRVNIPLGGLGDALQRLSCGKAACEPVE
ncbi:MAG: invasion associated locus B family protein [Rhizobiaceae bacterium]|nr:invasion associated locus B family protein [Rhizobiaceae bacterium]